MFYHFVCEGVAKNEWSTTYLNTQLNTSEMCTKSLPCGENRTCLTGYFFHCLCQIFFVCDGVDIVKSGVEPFHLTTFADMEVSIVFVSS